MGGTSAEVKMDSKTLQYYDGNAAEVAAKYDAIEQNEWRRLFQDSFKAGGRILDIGSGSGRDLALLLEMGFDAYGCEPSEGMRWHCCQNYPATTGRIYFHGLPLPENEDMGGPFDGMVCSAVFQHVPEAERADAAFSLKRHLCEGGRLWITVPDRRSGLNEEHRDDTGRLFHPVHPEYLVRLFAKQGFQLLNQWEEKDRLGRPGISWNSFLFERRDLTVKTA